MNVLLDTHLFLLFDFGSPLLEKNMRFFVAPEPNRLCQRRLDLGDTAIKGRAGKLIYEGAPRTPAADAGFVELAIDAADAETAGALDWSHRDPIDRMLVAVLEQRFDPFVAADARLRVPKDIAVMWAG